MFLTFRGHFSNHIFLSHLSRASNFYARDKLLSILRLAGKSSLSVSFSLAAVVETGKCGFVVSRGNLDTEDASIIKYTTRIW